jgi:hypothetical protein
MIHLHDLRFSDIGPLVVEKDEVKYYETTVRLQRN